MKFNNVYGRIEIDANHRAWIIGITADIEMTWDGYVILQQAKAVCCRCASDFNDQDSPEITWLDKSWGGEGIMMKSDEIEHFFTELFDLWLKGDLSLPWWAVDNGVAPYGPEKDEEPQSRKTFDPTPFLKMG